MNGVDACAALEILCAYNAALDDAVPFDPKTLDGRVTKGLTLPNPHWAP